MDPLRIGGCQPGGSGAGTSPPADQRAQSQVCCLQGGRRGSRRPGTGPPRSR